MYVCIYIYISKYIQTRIYKYKYIHKFFFNIYIYYAMMIVRKFTIWPPFYVSTDIYTYIYIYIYTYIYIYISQNHIKEPIALTYIYICRLILYIYNCEKNNATKLIDL